MGGLTWRGASVTQDVEKEVMKNLWAAAIFLQSRLREKINRGNPAPGDNPSAPGEAPKKRTGNLQDNVLIKADKGSLRITVGLGLNADYGIWLEFGTSRIAPRPWIRSTWEESKAGVMALASGGKSLS